MKIAIDAYGGDLAPLEMIKGASAARELGEQLVLCGDEQGIRECAEQNGVDISGIEIMPADCVMDMHDEAKAVL